MVPVRGDDTGESEYLSILCLRERGIVHLGFASLICQYTRQSFVRLMHTYALRAWHDILVARMRDHLFLSLSYRQLTAFQDTLACIKTRMIFS